MARHIIDEYINKPADFVDYIIRDFAKRYNMKVVERNGERYLEGKDYVLGGVTRFKHTYQEGHIHIEAWIKGSFGKELDLEGVWGWAIKDNYRGQLNELMNALRQPLPTDAASEQNPYMAAIPTELIGQPVMVQGTGNPEKANAAMWLAIAAIILVFFNTWLSAILAGLAWQFAQRAIGTTEDKKARIAYGLCIGVVILIFLTFLIRIAGIVLASIL